MQKRKACYAVILAIAVLYLIGCGGPSNKTSVDGAKVFVQAMVKHDANLMKYINHSYAFLYPPQYCLEIATQENWSKYDLSKFTYKDLGNGQVRVTFPNGERETILKMVQENGRWFFSDMQSQ